MKKKIHNSNPNIRLICILIKVLQNTRKTYINIFLFSATKFVRIKGKWPEIELYIGGFSVVFYIMVMGKANIKMIFPNIR